jgi:sterol desaturase/sphingolipid hydroxylase (fatty acid hydroxylase superfamily)
MRNQKEIRQWWAENVSYKKCDDVCDHDVNVVMPLESDVTVKISVEQHDDGHGHGHGHWPRQRTKNEGRSSGNHGWNAWIRNSARGTRRGEEVLYQIRFQPVTIQAKPLSASVLASIGSAVGQRDTTFTRLLSGLTGSTRSATMNSALLLSFGDRLLQGPDALASLDFFLLGLGILAALEFLNWSSEHFGDWFRMSRIPVRGKHLDEFSLRDYLFIGFSKLSLPPFVYFYFRYAFYCDAVPWHPSDVSLVNTIPALVLLFIVYDFFYTILHWFLHVKGVYSYIHKHHHHQKAPSRANVDAINVHPLEFFLGEYNHLWALYLTTQFILPVHITTAVLFLGIGGFVAGLNHTRHNVVLRLGNLTIFDSKVHDVHHRIPQSNYGQYIMLWDYIFGSYRYDLVAKANFSNFLECGSPPELTRVPFSVKSSGRAYNPDDSVNPQAQLDPKTGKSLSWKKAV